MEFLQCHKLIHPNSVTRFFRHTETFNNCISCPLFVLDIMYIRLPVCRTLIIIVTNVSPTSIDEMS